MMVEIVHFVLGLCFCIFILGGTTLALIFMAKAAKKMLYDKEFKEFFD